MSNSYQDIESRIQDAINATTTRTEYNIASLAREFDVPETRLRVRHKGRLAKTERRGANNKLTLEQEVVVCRYLDRLDKMGMSARLPMMVNCANALLRRSHSDIDTSPPTVSEAWPKRFLAAHPEYQKKKQKSLDADRKKSHQSTGILAWFDGFRREVEEKGIVPNDIYNFDETGFRIGVGKTQWIITRDAQRRSFLESANNRESVTCVEAISADGSVLPPMIILSAAQHLERWFDNSLEDDVLFAVSETGYSNDELSLRWIEHFATYSAKRQHRIWRLLLFDGYGSHCTFEFLDYCQTQKIVPFCLPPHSSHLLQPLDVVVFQPYKHFHGEAIDVATRSGCTDFNKVEFLHVLTSICRQTFKPTTIQSAFCKTGLYPHNPQVVLENMREYASTRPVTPPHSPALDPSLPPSTPLTIRTLTRQADQLKQLDISPSIQSRIETFIKGSLIQAQAGAQALDDLEHHSTEGKARKNRGAANKKVIQKGGVLYARDARLAVQRREGDDVQKAREVLARADAHLERQHMTAWKLVIREVKRRIKEKITERKEMNWTQRALCHEIDLYSSSGI